ncbi:MAG: hypothetical protein IID45_15795 [Planctomycetes bacterium]|nr:hypothetical protein [Planctomycetota bacterium]
MKEQQSSLDLTITNCRHSDNDVIRISVNNPGDPVDRAAKTGSSEKSPQSLATPQTTPTRNINPENTCLHGLQALALLHFSAIVPIHCAILVEIPG